ncbi:MAG: hypothetical protein M3N07_01970 [Pseudomonadota bacterium]|nr:hypothetical protein [Pseudomonadota bacterium]
MIEPRQRNVYDVQQRVSGRGVAGPVERHREPFQQRARSRFRGRGRGFDRRQ